MSDAGTLGVVDRTIASTRVPLGAPGLYLLKESTLRPLGPQRMDVAAFVGVAPRGPAYVPVIGPEYETGWHLVDADRPRRRSVAVAVTSFDEYRRSFGGFEGPGLLAQSVAAFFEQGGRRTYVVRIVAPRADPLDGLAIATVTDIFTAPLLFRARDQGAWGNGLAISVRLDRTAVRAVWEAAGTVLFDRASDAPPGTLLLLGMVDGTRAFAYVEGLAPVRDPLTAATRWRATVDTSPAADVVTTEVVTARLTIRDPAGIEESFTGVGLDVSHPRWLASVLCDESVLIWPDAGWANGRLVPAEFSVDLLRSRHDPFSGGESFYGDIVPDDMFDATWSPAEDEPGDGITALAALNDVTQLVVPDLYIPAVWAGDGPEAEPPGADAGAVFADCVTTVATPVTASGVPPSALVGLILDPRHDADLATIIDLQSRILAFCETTRAMIGLLDMPPGLTRGRMERWRNGFDSAWCAAYHPWLRPSLHALSGGAGPRPIPPSALGAGIIARKELARGIQTGPANELAAGIVDLAERVSEALVDGLHPIGINCFLRGTDGIRLVAARTLSRDAQWRQLSVRRLMLMLRRVLLHEMQWAVFEPNGPTLAQDMRHSVEGLLRRLFRAGAFAGATEDQSFFVRISQDRQRQDRGEILVEIGVAPVEPTEYLVLRLLRQGDGNLALEG